MGNPSILALPDVTCRMESHSVTCHPTQVSWYSIYLSRREGRLSWLRLPGSAPAGVRTCDLSITPNHYTTGPLYSSLGWRKTLEFWSRQCVTLESPWHGNLHVAKALILCNKRRLMVYTCYHAQAHGHTDRRTAIHTHSDN